MSQQGMWCEGLNISSNRIAFMVCIVYFQSVSLMLLVWLWSKKAHCISYCIFIPAWRLRHFSVRVLEVCIKSQSSMSLFNCSLCSNKLKPLCGVWTMLGIWCLVPSAERVLRVRASLLNVGQHEDMGGFGRVTADWLPLWRPWQSHSWHSPKWLPQCEPGKAGWWQDTCSRITTLLRKEI